MITQAPPSMFEPMAPPVKKVPPTWFKLDLHSSITLDLLDHLAVSADDDADRVSWDGNLWCCRVVTIQFKPRTAATSPRDTEGTYFDATATTAAASSPSHPRSIFISVPETCVVSFS